MIILGLPGSLRTASINAALLRAASFLAPHGMEVSSFAGLGELPLFNPDLEINLPAKVVAFHAAIAAADGLIVASPEYAHGVTGVIKNALDWLVSFEPFANMPVAVLNASGRAHHADAALRETLRTMSAFVVEEASISIPLLGSAPSDDAMLADAKVAQAIISALTAFQREIERTRSGFSRTPARTTPTVHAGAQPRDR